MGFLEITGRRMEGGTGHEHIRAVGAVTRSGETLLLPTSDVVDWLATATNVAVVYALGRATRFIVGPYRAPDGTRCLRAYTQSGWEDHLLALPEVDSWLPRAALPSEGVDEPREPLRAASVERAA